MVIHLVRAVRGRTEWSLDGAGSKVLSIVEKRVGETYTAVRGQRSNEESSLWDDPTAS
jgi:hypothetical protein